jgi:hypothetical protein
MATQLKGQDRSINHTNVPGAVDSEIVANYTTFVPGQHTSGANRMKVRSIWEGVSHSFPFRLV